MLGAGIQMRNDRRNIGHQPVIETLAWRIGGNGAIGFVGVAEIGRHVAIDNHNDEGFGFGRGAAPANGRAFVARRHASAMAVGGTGRIGVFNRLAGVQALDGHSQ